MIMEHHYDEEVLAEFLAEPNDAVSRDKHLASCDLCLRTLDSLRATAHVLREPAVWDRQPISTAPRPETLAFLRGVAKTMADEDAMASVWIKGLLAGPREGWAARLAEHPEWRTGGMVRRLLKESEVAVSQVPEDAVAMGAIAVQLTEPSVSGDLSTAMRHLRGLAYYYRAYAVWYTGALLRALEDLDRADNYLRDCSAAEFDRARVALVRAMIYQMVERRDEALRIANAAASTFARYEDRDRVAAARTVAAITLQEGQRHRDALATHTEISEMAGITDRWRLSALNNMGLCYTAIGEYDRAADYLVRAISGYERIGMLTFRSKSRWALADTLAQDGQHEQALALYTELRAEFEELGMANDVALASLDMAESLLALGHSAKIGEICRAAIAYFVANGLAQTEPALRGLSYLQEVAAAGRATTAAIRNVRAFLRAPSPDATLLFAEPPQ